MWCRKVQIIHACCLNNHHSFMSCSVLPMTPWLRKRLSRKPVMLYLITIFLLYPLIQGLHLVRLLALENPNIMGSNIKLDLKGYANGTNLNLDGAGDGLSRTYASNPEQHVDASSVFSIKNLAEDLLNELRVVHRELMELLKSPLTTNKTEAHNLNTQVLLMMKKVNKHDSLQDDRSILGVIVEVKDIIYKEMKLIRKLTPCAKKGIVMHKLKVPPTQSKSNKKAIPKPTVTKVKHCLKLNFADPPMAVTALASYPGSGNTWLRHLIQEATGLLTGSLHSDPYLTKGGFPGEKTSNGKVVVVKSHSQPDSLKNCTKAILLLRNPYRSLLADFNRHNRINSNEHTGHAPEKLFKEPEWDIRANTLGADWYLFYDGWLEFKKPLLVLSYEDLRINTKYHLKRIVQFLGLNIPEKNYECMLNNTEGSYHRKPKTVEVNLFNKMQVDTTKLYADMINEKLRKYNVTVDTTVPH